WPGGPPCPRAVELARTGRWLADNRATPGSDELSVGVEVLNAVIPGVRDVDASVPTDGDAPGLIELALAGALRSPRSDELPGRAEHLDPVILTVGDIQISRWADRHALRRLELKS